MLCCGVLFPSDAPEIESDKSFPFRGLRACGGEAFCMPAGQERRDISQIAQNALHKIEQLFRKNLAIPLALMYNGLDLKGRMFKNTLPYAAADDLKGGTWDVV